MRIFLVFIFVIVSSFGLWGQENGKPVTPPATTTTPTTSQPITSATSGQSVDHDVLFRNEATIGLMAHTHGFGLNYRRGRHVTGKIKAVMEFEFTNIKHSKEVKIHNQASENSKGFYYGKLNAFQTLRVGVGSQHILYGKAERKSVEVRYLYFIGASLGLLKPVYLQIIHPTTKIYEVVFTTERYDPLIHFPDNIYGRSSYLKGIEQTKLQPGGYAKFAFSFEYASWQEEVKALEVGASLDLFAAPVPIMAFNKANRAFINLYINLHFGKKWY